MGIHAASQVVEGNSANQILDENFEGSAIPLLASGSAMLDFSVSQESYIPGDTIGISSYRLTNLTGVDQIAEMKIWCTGPVMAPLAIGNVGTNGRYIVPAGSHEESSPIPLLPVVEDMPGGEYAIGARILDPATGDILAQSQRRFAIASARNSAWTSPAAVLKPGLDFIRWGNETENPATDVRDLISPTGFNFRNTGAEDAVLELKFWLASPSRESIPIFSLGADGSLVLPAGSDIQLEPLSQFRATHELSRGIYQLKARMMDPVTGQIWAERSVPVLIP